MTKPNLLLNLPSPIEKLDYFDKYNVDVYIKRDDLIHPDFGGNKWRKLKYNVQAFKEGNFETLVTFGGPFSNHIAATASICQTYAIPCVGFIRGEISDSYNPTLNRARQNGMTLVAMPRSEYRHKDNSTYFKDKIESYVKPYIVPEGGSNKLALKGVKECMQEIQDYNIAFEYVVSAAGSGGTAAGLISEVGKEKVVVINVLKNQGLEEDILQLCPNPGKYYSIISDYHFGGFAKVNQELQSYIRQFFASSSVALDPVYNGKSMYGLEDLIRQGAIAERSKVLYLHTGGSQGITAYNYIKGKKLL